jgi:perosamine synthetase
MCLITVDDAAHCQPLRDYLTTADIETRPLFYPAHTMPHCATNQSFPIAESVSVRGINLPSYPALSEEQVSSICAEIHQYFKKQ